MKDYWGTCACIKQCVYSRGDIEEGAERFELSALTVRSLLRLRRETGSLAPKKQLGPGLRLSDEQAAARRANRLRRPSLTLAELWAWL